MKIKLSKIVPLTYYSTISTLRTVTDEMIKDFSTDYIDDVDETQEDDGKYYFPKIQVGQLHKYGSEASYPDYEMVYPTNEEFKKSFSSLSEIEEEIQRYYNDEFLPNMEYFKLYYKGFISHDDSYPQSGRWYVQIYFDDFISSGILKKCDGINSSYRSGGNSNNAIIHYNEYSFVYDGEKCLETCTTEPTLSRINKCGHTLPDELLVQCPAMKDKLYYKENGKWNKIDAYQGQFFTTSLPSAIEKSSTYQQCLSEYPQAMYSGAGPSWCPDMSSPVHCYAPTNSEWNRDGAVGSCFIQRIGYNNFLCSTGDIDDDESTTQSDELDYTTVPHTGANYCKKFVSYANTSASLIAGGEECKGSTIEDGTTDFSDKVEDIALRNGIRIYNASQDPVKIDVLNNNSDGRTYVRKDGAEIDIDEWGYVLYIDIDNKSNNGSKLWEDVFPFYVTLSGKVIPAFDMYSPEEYGGDSRNFLQTTVQDEFINDQSRQIEWVTKSKSFKESACKMGYIKQETPYCVAEPTVTKAEQCSNPEHDCRLKYIMPARFF
jgi:hypothetical protein